MDDTDLIESLKASAESTAAIFAVMKAVLVCIARQPGIDRNLLLDDLRGFAGAGGDDAFQQVYAGAMDRLAAAVEALCPR